MSIPQRMNLNNIRVTQLDIAANELDDDFNEPDGGTKEYETTLNLQAQVVFSTFDKTHPSWTGDLLDCSGWLVFRAQDLVDASVTLNKADLFTGYTGIAGTIETVSYKFVEIRPAGFLNGKPNLVKAYFKENEDLRSSS